MGRSESSFSNICYDKLRFAQCIIRNGTERDDCMNAKRCDDKSYLFNEKWFIVRMDYITKSDFRDMEIKFINVHFPMRL